MKEIIKKHAFMLLRIYGVKEEEIKKNPEGLKTFTELLLLELRVKLDKYIGLNKD